uniref:DNA/RNA-binding protein Alba-like domain-containing protein n=1 Tax=Lactuca sativa TaxID=4236 RepID=A0A9R1VYM9_LACSA|nr:hypothetical protein LSAT_V11C400210820 [Lactuca sativa]
MVVNQTVFSIYLTLKNSALNFFVMSNLSRPDLKQELLALGEQIGNAGSGLSEDFISGYLKTRRRIAGLHQITSIGSADITDMWEPLEARLLPLETTRHMSVITITLSRKELDTSSIEYQQPIPDDLVKPLVEYDHEGDGSPNMCGRGRARGRGRGRGNYNNRGIEYNGDGGREDGQGYGGGCDDGRGFGGRGRGRGRGRGGYRGCGGGGGYRGGAKRINSHQAFLRALRVMKKKQTSVRSLKKLINLLKLLNKKVSKLESQIEKKCGVMVHLASLTSQSDLEAKSLQDDDKDDLDNITHFLILAREPIIPGIDKPQKKIKQTSSDVIVLDVPSKKLTESDTNLNPCILPFLTPLETSHHVSLSKRG